MTQKFFKLLLLVSCMIPMQVCASSNKQFNSLQVAGPLVTTGLASVNALNVKNGADFGGDVAVDGTLFVDGGIVLDSCLVLTCTTAGQLLVNNNPVMLAMNYFYAYTTDNLASNTFYTPILFDNIAPINGWIYNNIADTFVCPETGVYEIAYSALVTTTGFINEVSFAIFDDATILPGSISVVAVPNRSNTLPGDVSLTLEAQLSAGDQISLQWGCNILTGAALTHLTDLLGNQSVSAALAVQMIN